MSEKTIILNPDLLITNKRNTTKKKNIDTSQFYIKPTKLRSKLINKVKNFQKKNSKEDVKNESNNLETFTNDFNESINFLENLSKKKKF